MHNEEPSPVTALTSQVGRTAAHMLLQQIAEAPQRPPAGAFYEIAPWGKPQLAFFYLPYLSVN